MGRIKNVEEIMEITKSHQASPDKMAFKIIIKKIDRALRFRAENRQVDASIQIPSILVSTPEYDRKNVTYKVYQHYSDMGFKCCRDIDGDKFKLNISWGSQLEESDSDVESDDSINDSEELSEKILEPRPEEQVHEKKTIVLNKKETMSDRIKKLA